MKTATTANIITAIRGLIKDILKTDGKDTFIYDSDNSFSLSEDHVSSSTISVYQNGSLLTKTTDWTYNSTTNKVIISASLTKNDTIIIVYSYYCKYSDTEIKSYIKANLVRFTKYQYSKYFYMNSSDEIVSLDGFNPSVQEGNIIALITAIDIDPQNIRTQITGMFTIDAVESMSKQEQIQDVFNKWLFDYGTLDFLELEDEE
ncbi:MAG: hypothetical protein ACTSWG_10485 [Candidatus Helarchaeota archaeon]